MESPLDILFPYQRAFVEDDARFKLFVSSRQIGKSFALAFDVVRDCVLSPNALWLAVSRGERQAKEWLLKAKNIAVLFCDFSNQNGVPITITKNSVSELVFSNGSRIIAVPNNPDTIRGYSGNLIIDELAFFENCDEFWASIVPTITNELNGKKRLIVASTFNGKGNKFYKIFEEKNDFSKYLVNIEQAVACGLDVDINELKRAVGDEDVWKQEFMCIPVESGQTLISIDLFRASVRASCSTEIPLDDMRQEYRSFYAGIDIGRKHDLTAIWVLEKIGDKLHTRMIKELRNKTFAEQRAEICKILECRAVRKCRIDATGIGAQLAEELNALFHDRVEQCRFTNDFKQEIFISMQRAFQDGKIYTPQNKGELERDVCAIQKITTASGLTKYYAPSNEDGHSDRATALALAISSSGIIDSRPRSINAGFNSGRFIMSNNRLI